MPPPLLIALPSNLIVSGVATWAVRLVSALAAAGRATGLIVHQTSPGHARLDISLHPAVRVYDLTDLGLMPNVEPASHSTREAWIGAYSAAICGVHAAGGAAEPVILSPNLHADCYAVGVESARRAPDLVRLVGWQHNDIEYDRRVLAHYEPALAEIVGVSDHTTSLLRTLLPGRSVTPIAYGVEVPRSPARRSPLATAARSRPVRLLYTGRLDHHQKRILALPHMSRSLHDMGIDHELTILGDGPAAADLDRLIGVEANSERARERDRMANATPSLADRCLAVSLPNAIRLVGPASPTQVRDALAHHDAFILPSRFEGLSVSMLEALAAGCVPIVARVESGALQAITPGVTGLIADVSPDADEASVGLALAHEVARFLACDSDAMSRAAWASASDRYSLDAHAGCVSALLDRAAATPPMNWPPHKPVWFSDPGGSIPTDAPARIARVLQSLAGRRVIVHATGHHTRTLLPHLLAGPAIIVGFTDDDRQQHASTLAGLPIVAPESASTLNATDVLISTSMHETAVWARRRVYERQGLAVHRIYE